MKIIDIMKESAAILGLTEEIAVMQMANENYEADIFEQNQNVARLFELLKYSIREFCTNYMPLIDCIKINVVNNRFPVSGLQNYVRIQKIMKNSQQVNFKLINRTLVFEEDGEYEIYYLTYPEITSMFEEIDFLSDFNPDVLVFGLCSYYALSHGMFSEFEEMHEQYIQKAESLKNLKIFELPCRRWE